MPDPQILRACALTSFASPCVLLLLVLSVTFAGCTSAPSASSASPRISPARTPEEAGFVDVQTLIPDLRLDIRYAGRHNFVGTPVDGYEAPKCYLLRPVAEALRRVVITLHARHQSLQVFDCYRPVRAVRHFMRWARDPGDQKNKAEFYPTLDKRTLVPQYIAEHSGHSRGATLDLTLLQCDAADDHCAPLDMGTAFDYFGEPAHTDSPSVSATQRANRHVLRDAMQAQGFRNYADEWWHYTYQPEPTPDMAYDFPIR